MVVKRRAAKPVHIQHRQLGELIGRKTATRDKLQREADELRKEAEALLKEVAEKDEQQQHVDEELALLRKQEKELLEASGPREDPATKAERLVGDLQALLQGPEAQSYQAVLGQLRGEVSKYKEAAMAPTQKVPEPNHPQPGGAGGDRPSLETAVDEEMHILDDLWGDVAVGSDGARDKRKQQLAAYVEAVVKRRRG